MRPNERAFPSLSPFEHSTDQPRNSAFVAAAGDGAGVQGTFRTDLH
jgi:hypothetical protein